eukprot:TRINITY_DN62932_c0_g1_i1.p1 TRINITY_DN62932_c0_g1~~TRINITY_DN62932_c0_g1_i1.p1  ORF type:complete len:227 (+),score=44.04 TRINITY_DN62932_c0_g1_i1:52-681(+)
MAGRPPPMAFGDVPGAGGPGAPVAWTPQQLLADAASNLAPQLLLGPANGSLSHSGSGTRLRAPMQSPSTTSLGSTGSTDGAYIGAPRSAPRGVTDGSGATGSPFLGSLLSGFGAAAHPAGGDGHLDARPGAIPSTRRAGFGEVGPIRPKSTWVIEEVVDFAIDHSSGDDTPDRSRSKSHGASDVLGFIPCFAPTCFDFDRHQVLEDHTC